MGYESEQNDPKWFDVMRPVKLPGVKNEFGRDGHFYSGVRQSRLSVKSYTPTDHGELKTIFEFELFGTGVDAGQTTFRLRHAWGELGQIGAGQTWSVFMDPDVFPNSIEYWGPNGMVFFRNVQLRWTPWSDAAGSSFAVAIERPGASADQGDFASRIELQNVRGRFPAPDISAHYRHARDWGHVQVAGIVRWMRWDDILDDQFDCSGSDTGWGINLSSNLKFAKHVARLQVVYGEGVQNYFNDAPVDVGIVRNPSNPRTPILGEALPALGIVAFLDSQLEPPVDQHRWLLAGGHHQQRRPERQRVPQGSLRAGEHPLLPDEERLPRPGTAVGQAGQLLGRVHLGRRPDPVLGQIQLQSLNRRPVMPARAARLMLKSSEHVEISTIQADASHSLPATDNTR